MGTEVLYPQDVLVSRDLGSLSPSASFAPLRRQSFRSSTARNPKLRRRKGEGFAEAKVGENAAVTPITGQVKILKRGELLEASEGGRDRLRTAELMELEEGVKVAMILKGDVYAGSAFTQSPSPRALPLPKFCPRREEEGEEVDQSATKDLLRLLRLE